MTENVNIQSAEAVALELMKKIDKNNVVKFIFDYFPIDCINAQHLDSEQLDTAIELFKEDTDNLTLLTDIVKIIHAATQENKDAEKHFARRITSYLDVKYSETNTIFQIAEELNISYHYLSHFVKRHFGISLTALRNKVRIRKAKIALAESEDSVSQIATSCGFDNISYFTEVFTKQEGVSPRNYRAQYAGKKYFDFYDDDDIALANMLPQQKLTSGDLEKVSTAVKTYAVSMPDAEYKFLHETAIIEYHGILFASWYNCPEKELRGHTPVRGKRSYDGGVTWSDVEVIDEQADGGDSIIFCPPVYGICDGKLYMFINEMVSPDRIHALNLYVLDDKIDRFVKLWSRPIPFKLNTNVVTLPNGKLMLPGRIGKLDAFPNTPAVLLSDSGKMDAEWRLVKLAESGDLPDGSVYRHPEMSAVVMGDKVYMFCRNDTRRVPIVYVSADNGETWSAPTAHDIPFSDSKIYAGTLRDGRHYVVGNVRSRGRNPRAILTLYITEQGSDRFSKTAVLKDGAGEDFPESHIWHYPAVTEQDGKLKIICTVSFKDKSRGAVLIDVDTNSL